MPDRTAIGDEDLAVFGDHLCEQTGRCTCEALDTGAQVVHRDDCGYEPVYTVSNVTWALGVSRRAAHRHVRMRPGGQGVTAIREIKEATK